MIQHCFKIYSYVNYCISMLQIHQSHVGNRYQLSCEGQTETLHVCRTKILLRHVHIFDYQVYSVWLHPGAAVSWPECNNSDLSEEEKAPQLSSLCA